MNKLFGVRASAVAQGIIISQRRCRPKERSRGRATRALRMRSLPVQLIPQPWLGTCRPRRIYSQRKLQQRISAILEFIIRQSFDSCKANA
jgi:hypothetical protein